MAEDWAADVKKYVPNADDGTIAGVVRYCGIALQKRDSALVAFSDKKETDRVRENFLKKKLALTDADSVLDAAIAAVGERMKADRTKNRVTVYYLLADKFGKLGLFQKATKPAAKTKAPAKAPAATKAPAKAPAATKAPAKAKTTATTKAPAKAKAPAKTAASAPAKTKITAKPKPAAKLKATAKAKAPAKKATSKAAAAGAGAAAVGLASLGSGSKGGGAATGTPANDAGGGSGGGATAGAAAALGAAGAAVTGAASSAADTAGKAGAAAVGAAGAAVAGAASLAGKAGDSVGGAVSGLSQSIGGKDEESGGSWNWLLWLALALLALYLIWRLFFSQAGLPSDTEAVSIPASTEAAADLSSAPAEGTVAIPTGAGVTSELRDGKPVVKVYFDSGKTDVAAAFAGAADGLKGWLASNQGSSLAISGYADPSGNAALNAELSKKRAQAVQAALIAAGVPESSAELVKPDSATDVKVDAASARRVEVVVR